MIDLDSDPRLTAYVLDELDPDEREIFEQDMANADADVGGVIREIKALAAMLDEVYASEPDYQMTEEQRLAVLGGATVPGDLELLEDQVDEDGKVLPWVVRATIGKEEKAAVAEFLRPSNSQRLARVALGLGIAASLAAGMFWAFSQMGGMRGDVVAQEAPIELEASPMIDPTCVGYGEGKGMVAMSGEKPALEPDPGKSMISFTPGTPKIELGDEALAIGEELDLHSSVVADASIGGGLGFGVSGLSAGGGGAEQLAVLQSSSRGSYMSSVDPSVTADGDERLLTGSGSLVMRSKTDEVTAKAEMDGLRTTLSTLSGLQGDDLLTAAADLGISNPTFSQRYPQYEQLNSEHQALLDAGLGPGHPKLLEAENFKVELQKSLVEAVRSTETALTTKLALAQQVLMQQEQANSQESYATSTENPFKNVLEANNQLSTFSIDVDTASYANVRRILRSGAMPPAGAVRIEEMVNYFNYAYPQPQQPHPFSANLEVAACPWKKGHRLVRIGLKGREVEAKDRPDSNLVFLIDVSGSMQSHYKLPLLKQSMMGLVKNLREQDMISIVVYAGNSGLVLDATSGALQEELLSAIGRLEAGGSTNGGAGIELAYRVAKEHFIKGGVNRVILATDGDFNVGVTDQESLVKMVAERAKDNIYLTVLGFGEGNLKDKLIEEISNRGNGNSHYIDSAREGHRVLVEEMGSTLETIAKDVKIQVEFNPAKVASYRLIGYENRMLRNRDFNDDRVDAGEVGAGHTVTALYQVVPAGIAGEVDELKYGAEKAARRDNDSPELLTVKMRYKQPDGDVSTRFELALVDEGKGWEASSADFRFAASVAGFGMLLKNSAHGGNLNYELVKELASEGMDHDPQGYRKEFLDLVDATQRLRGK